MVKNIGALKLITSFILIFSFQLSAKDYPSQEAYDASLRVYNPEMARKNVKELPSFTQKDLDLMSEVMTGEFLHAAYTRLAWDLATRDFSVRQQTELFLNRFKLLTNFIEQHGTGEYDISLRIKGELSIMTHSSADMLEKVIYFAEAAEMDERLRERIRTRCLDLVAITISKPNHLPSQLEITRGFLDKNRPQAESITEKDLIQVTQQEYLVSLARAQKIKKDLESRIIGQPEVVEHYYDLLLKQAFTGLGRSLPSVTYKMGQPGNGKDTSAEAFVDALFGEKGTHSKMIPDVGATYLFRIQPVKSDADIWALLGSATGYKGSDNMPPLLRWLVKFSAGKYMIVPGEKTLSGKEKDIIKENPQWQPGMVLEGFYPPEMGVLYLYEFHNWSKKAKDLIVKLALEKGYFPINNPGEGGVSELYVPIHFDIASNEGIGLVTARDVDGTPHGDPKSYIETLDSYEAVHNNKRTLRDEILKTSQIDIGSNSDGARGLSEEMLNRIPDESLILMRPLSPLDLQKIANIKLKQLAEKLSLSEGEFGRVYIEWSDNLVRAIQEYRYNAEENARPLDDRISSFVEKSMFDAVKEGKIKDDGKDKYFRLDIRLNEDKSSSLLFLDAKNPEKILFTQDIRTTYAERDNKKISKKELAKLLTLESRLKQHVFGAEHALKEIANAVILAEADKTRVDSPEALKESSKAYFLLGYSSTGKSETAKALARELFPEGEKALATIDFNQVTNSEDMKRLFYGYKNSAGIKVPSAFMKEYDKRNGRMVISFEEIANLVFKGLGNELMSLYDLLREPVVRSFIDNKPRSMKNVIILMTGNAGKEWYDGIPKNIPMNERQEAMLRIYNLAVKDNSFILETLEKYFTEAFGARVGLHRTFFYSPLTFTAIRQLSFLKLNQSIEALRPREAAYGWNVQFETEKDYLKMVELIERHGFEVGQQGASIEQFVNTTFAKKLNRLLLENIAPESNVYLSIPSDSEERLKTDFVIEVRGENKSLDLFLPKRKEVESLSVRPTDKILTAYHEAGHHVASKVLLGDKYEADLISIEPGVTNFAGKWLRYLGIARSKGIEHIAETREYVIREMAVLLAGSKAQEIVSVNSQNDAGKQNDIERATRMAKIAITQKGLSARWGNRSLSEEELKHLDEKSRRLLHDEIDLMLKEADVLAERVLLLNFNDILAPLAVDLAKKATLDSEYFKLFYEQFGNKIVYPEQTVFRPKLKPRENNLNLNHNAELKEGVPQPKVEELADIAKKIEERRRAEVSAIKISEKAPIKNYQVKLLGHDKDGGSCKKLF